MMKHVVAIIPARAGSKGIPRKNMTSLCGIPLIQYTIDAALRSSVINHIIISTDSDEIMSYAAQHGCLQNDLRPADLATDTATTIDVMAYEIQKYESQLGAKVDDVILLQPTAALRVAADIDTAYDIYQRSEGSSLISCYDAESVHPNIMYTQTDNTLVPYTKNDAPRRRQDFEKIYVRNGAIYISSRDLIINDHKIIGDHPAFYEMPKERSVNIDSHDDLLLAEYRLSRTTQ